MQLSMVWSDFKTRINAGIAFRAVSVSGVYYLAATMDIFEFDCQILQDGGSDQTDYENNYASLAANFSISPLAPGSYRNITGNSTVEVKSSAGVIMGIMINNNSTGGTITIYDNTAASGTKIGTLQIGTPSGGLLSTSGITGTSGFIAINTKFTTGLTVVTAGSTSNDVTIIYR